jgi:uncharacterized membrane protein YidH (DUF202 family)
MPIPEVIPLTLNFVGTLLIGFAVLKVHAKMRSEEKIDKHVRKTIRKERTITIIGLILIVLGYILYFI